MITDLVGSLRSAALELGIVASMAIVALATAMPALA